MAKAGPHRGGKRMRIGLGGSKQPRQHGANSASDAMVPNSPSANASTAPPAAKPSAGVPQAMASRKAMPKPSPLEGMTKRSAIR